MVQPSEYSANLLCWDDIVVDLDGHLAARGDRQIPLSPTEFKLLSHLVGTRTRCINARSCWRRSAPSRET